MQLLIAHKKNRCLLAIVPAVLLFILTACSGKQEAEESDGADAAPPAPAPESATASTLNAPSAPSAPPTMPGAEMGGGSAQQLVAEARQIQERLQKVQMEAIEANEALQQQMEEVQTLVQEQVDEVLTNSTVDELTGRLEEIQSDLQATGEAPTPDSPQIQEYQEMVQTLQAAESTVMQNPEVQAAQQAIQTNLMEAMNAVDENTEQMIQRLMAIQRQLQQSQPAPMMPPGN